MDISKIRSGMQSGFSRFRFALFPLLLIYLESILHIFAYGKLNHNTIWFVLFSIGIGSLFTVFISIFPKIVNIINTYVFTFLFTLVFGIELVYYEIFQGFASVSSIGMGGQAINNFKDQTIEGIENSIWWIFALALPLILLCIFGLFLFYKAPTLERIKLKWCSIPAAVSFVVLAGTICTMSVFFSGTPSLYKSFTSSKTPTDTSVSYFGLNMTVVQEVRFIISPEEKEATLEDLSTEEYSENAQIDKDIDFSALYEKAEDNTDLKNLTAELSNMPVTSKNQYTGLCKDYNLITLCCEAFSPEFIDPELTPALYKLSTNGFVFENFYSTFPNTTTNGEYTFCMGLYPDLSRGKTDSSFSISASNYLPYCYGNIFKDLGFNSYAYHNYVAEFYYRNYTHPNMGYEFTAANSGLDIPITWPSSDYDMMVNSVDDYINSGERFTAYYMTFSGHYQYDLDNAMSVKNWDTVEAWVAEKGLDYSEAVKAYIACNLELEYALAHLMEKLEAAGIADKTAIVLTTDHFPYGLKNKQYAELADREINNVFDKQKNAFICYVPGMEEPVYVDSYCSTADILPTVLNLFGFEYDSRLLAGHDVLAPDAINVAVIADGSFIADGVRFDSNLMKYRFTDGETKELRKYAEELYMLVEKRLRLSTDILNNDYYSFVFGIKSTSAEIDNITMQYEDVKIMEQSTVYYILKNEIMDPVSESSFGLSKKASIAEMIDSIYRIANRPEVEYDINEIPFNVPTEYESAVAWAYQNGIIRDDGIFDRSLKKTIKVGQAAVLVARTAAFFGEDVSVDEANLAELMTTYPDLSEEVIRASMFCRDKNIIVEDDNESYMFTSSDNTVKRKFVATALYRLCSYYIMVDDGSAVTSEITDPTEVTTVVTEEVVTFTDIQ